MERPAHDEGLKDEVFGSLVDYIHSVVRKDDSPASSLSGSEIDLSYHTPYEKIPHEPGFVHPVWLCLEDFSMGQISPGWIYFSESESARWCSLNIIVNDGHSRINIGNFAFVMKRINNTWQFVQIRFCNAE